MLNHILRVNLLRLNVTRSSFVKNRILIILTMFITVSCAQIQKNTHDASTKIDVLPDYVFSPSANLSQDVAQTLATAKEQNKKALLVLGAQWCHDSKALAKHFSTPKMQKILTDNYQVLFIDVGYLERGFEVVKQFNLPVYYGTPTVMVIDPISENILNRNSMKKWLNAYNLPLTEYIKYFSDFASATNDQIENSLAMQTYLQQITAFEQEQGARLKEAYGIIGPLLKQSVKSNNKSSPKGFSTKWKKVHDFRYLIQDDIQALIAQAKINVDAGSSTPLDFPSYPAFTWE